MYASFNMMMGAFDDTLLEDAFSPSLASLNYLYFIVVSPATVCPGRLAANGRLTPSVAGLTTIKYR